MRPRNLVILMADEHAGKYTGFAGHPIVKTPNLDRLAASGTVFKNAYCNSPICMPSRAAFATGRYPHDTGYVCNATPYDGTVLGWPHHLTNAGIPVTSIGKLHYRDAGVSSGFSESIVPMHAVNATGDLFGALRQTQPLPVRHGVRLVAEQVGRGESTYTTYDRTILSETLDWLTNTAPALSEPWVLFVSFVCPHFPLIAPDQFYDMYDKEMIPLPKACRPEDWPDHPWFEAFRASYITDTFFDDDLRREATAAYFGLCSFVDSLIGQVVEAVGQSSFGNNTNLLYTSDHGDNLGVRGLWQKSNFYQESAHVPMILTGPDVAAGETRNTPVSLVDIYPTVLDSVGLGDGTSPVNEDAESLFRLADAPDDDTRVVFGEYHGAGAVNGVFMLRQGPWKYVHFANMPEQLFNLDDDQEEMHNLATASAQAGRIEGFRKMLLARLDPVAVDADIKARQLELVNRHGGRERILTKGSMGASPPPGTKQEALRTE